MQTSSTQFELHLEGPRTPRFSRSRFQHARLHGRNGRSLLELTASRANLTWTAGPKALITFLVKARLWSLRNDASPSECRFDDQPEQTLGDAIRKPRAAVEPWKEAIFGFDEARDPLLYALLDYTRPAGRHAVGLRAEQLPPAEIRIFWDDREITKDEEALCALVGRLNEAYFNKVTLRSFLQTYFPLPESDEDRVSVPRDDLSSMVTRASDLVVITGLGGAGKTWLAQQAARRSLGDGKPVLWTTWKESDLLSTLVAEFRTKLHLVAKPDGDLKELKKLLPRKPGPISDCLVAKLAQALGRRGVELFLDNLGEMEWGKLLRFQEEFQASDGGGRIVITLRFLPQSLEGGHCCHIPVPPLTLEQIRTYFRNRCAETAQFWNDEIFQRIHEKSGGNFLFLAWIARIAEVLPIEQVLSTAPHAPADFFVQLTVKERRLLTLCAAFRGHFDFEAVQQVATSFGIPASRVAPLIADLCLKHGMLVAENRGGHPEYLVLDPIKEVLQGLQGEAALKDIVLTRAHGMLAQYYRERGVDPSNHIEAFYHRLKAGHATQAIVELMANEKYLFDFGYTTVLERCLCDAQVVLSDLELGTAFVAAGEKLIQARVAYFHGQFREALGCYDEAIERIERSPCKEEEKRACQALRLSALEQRGLVHRKLEDFDAARADFKALLKVAKTAESEVWKAHALSDLGMIWRERCYSRKAAQCFSLSIEARRGVLRRLEQGERSPEIAFRDRTLAYVQMADQHSLLSYCHLELGEYAEAQHHVEVAEEWFREADEYGKSNYYRGRYFCARAFIRARMKQWSGALRDARLAHRIPQEAGNKAGEIAGLYCLGVVYLMQSQSESAETTETASLAQQHLEACLDMLREDDGKPPHVKLAKVHKALSLAHATVPVSQHHEQLARDSAEAAGQAFDDIQHLLPLV
jgi:tetratricopeptide (TPR) repeat protein